MASLGSFLLLAAFVIASYAIAASVAGARRGSRRLIESGVGAFYLTAAVMTVGSAVITHAFVTNDYTISFTSSATRTGSSRCFTKSHRIGAAWTARSCSGCSCSPSSGRLSVYVNRERHRELIPYVVAVISPRCRCSSCS